MLEELLEKQEIIPTFNATELERDSPGVDALCRRYCATHVALGDTGEHAQRLVSQTVSSRSPRGVLVAPYGYGKTSTALFLWQQCEAANLVAVPPFIFEDLEAVLRAAHGWANYRLGQVSVTAQQEEQQLFERYRAGELEALAQHHAAAEGLPLEQARRLLQRMDEQGQLHLRLDGSRLFDYLREAANLVRGARYKGLVVIGDELQQYLDSTNLSARMDQLRHLVWRFVAGSDPLGLVLVMDDRTESIIHDRDRSILDRLRESNAYLNLRSIYNVEFPAALWSRYVELFQFTREEAHLLDDATLRAIGEIASSEVVGRGPRTVINAFKAAVRFWQEHHRPYTPIDLIDGFLTGEIYFEDRAEGFGRHHGTVAAVVNGVIESSEPVNTERKAAAIKLLAAFPLGCPEEVVRRYGLEREVDELSHALQGEVLVYRAQGGGFTLIPLVQPEGGSEPLMEQTREFWRQYQGGQAEAQDAAEQFRRALLPLLFPPRKGNDATSWTATAFEGTTTGSFVALYEGAFTLRYPRRLLRIQVALEEDQLCAAEELARDCPEPVHLHLDLVLPWRDEEGTEEPPSGRIERVRNGVMRVVLPLTRRHPQGVPQALTKLEQALNPRQMTPLLLLALHRRLARYLEERREGLPQRDQGEITYAMTQFLEVVLQVLFPVELAAQHPGGERGHGARFFQTLVEAEMQLRFPEYATFYRGAQYLDAVNDYCDVLHDVPLRVARGHAPIGETNKDRLAAMFDLQSVATFENRLHAVYERLVHRDRWERADAQLTLTLHPLEERLYALVRSAPATHDVQGGAAPALDTQELLDAGWELGYREEETELACVLLQSRGMVALDTDRGVVYIPPARGAEELGEQIRELRAACDCLPDELRQGDDWTRLLGQLSSVSGLYRDDLEDEEEVDELQRRLATVQQDFQGLLTQRRAVILARVSGAREQPRILVTRVQSASLDEPVNGQLGFTALLNDLRMKLQGERTKVLRNLNKALSDLGAVGQPEPPATAEALSELHARARLAISQAEAAASLAAALVTQIDDLGAWVRLLADAGNVYSSVSAMPDLQERVLQEFDPKVREYLVHQKLAGLPGHEQFRLSLDEIRKQRDDLLSQGNDRWAAEKEAYDADLRQVRAPETRLARFTIVDEQGSYDGLRDEVRECVGRRVAELKDELGRCHSEVRGEKLRRGASAAGNEILAQALALASQVSGRIGDAANLVTIGAIAEREEAWQGLIESLGAAAEDLAQLDQWCIQLLRETPAPTPEQQELLATLGDARDVDLLDLVLRAAGSEEDASVDVVFERLKGLFQKNLVRVKLSTQR